MMNYGIELELFELLLLQLFAFVLFGSFELETPAIRRIVKWLIFYGITIAVFQWLGHWALLFPIILTLPGIIYHLMWCKKNEIDPIKATPRKKYYQLRGWKWEE